MEYKLMNVKTHHIYCDDVEIRNGMIKKNDLMVIKYYSFRDYFEFKFWHKQNNDKIIGNECFEIDNFIFHGCEKVIKHFEE
jgi:hypothetical protein